jgi:hypothetical protein
VHFTPDLVQHDRVSSMAMTLPRSRAFRWQYLYTTTVPIAPRV